MTKRLAMVLPDSLRCLHCGYQWVPRIPSPKMCPQCHNREWNSPHRYLRLETPRRKKGKEGKR